MRYRKLTATGDYSFGNGSQDFYINTSEAVAQVVQTSLKLWLGEWYLNLNDGMPWPEGVLGKKSQAEADATVKAYVQTLQGVENIQDFKSVIDPTTRQYRVASMTLNTIYGPTQLEMENANNF